MGVELHHITTIILWVLSHFIVKMNQRNSNEQNVWKISKLFWTYQKDQKNGYKVLWHSQMKDVQKKTLLILAMKI